MKSVCLAAALAVLVPNVAFAQRGGWLDVNLGVASSTSGEQTYVYTGRLFGETYALSSVYDKPSTGASFDFGGGFMFTPLVGLGATFTGQGHQDVANGGISIPHPTRFNAFAVDGDTTVDKLTRAEGGTHITVRLVPVRGPFQFAVFGGPSFFRLKQDMIQDIRYTQDTVTAILTGVNRANITGFDIVEAEGTGVGFHVGADAAYYFTRVVGIGGMVRFTRGTVELDPEPLSELPQDVKVGGVHFGGGLRLRF